VLKQPSVSPARTLVKASSSENFNVKSVLKKQTSEGTEVYKIKLQKTKK